LFIKILLIWPAVSFVLLFFLCLCSSINPFCCRPSLISNTAFSFAVKQLTHVQLFLDRSQSIAAVAVSGAA
jgi:hypothetical protein